MVEAEQAYGQGHAESVVRSQHWRTVENSAAYLAPELRAGTDVLDVGCGPGTITVDIAERVAPGRVVGIDPSEAVLEQARANAAAAGVDNVVFQRGDVFALDAEAAAFDVVHAHQVLLHLVVVHGIGVTPAHPGWTLGFLLLTSFAFTAVVHALNAAFGPKGKFIALVVLVLQLVTAGGTFPWQTTPEVLHPLHKVLPLSYVVDALRQLIYGGTLADAGAAALVLGGYLVAGLLLSTIAAWRQRVWTPQRLKPELAL